MTTIGFVFRGLLLISLFAGFSAQAVDSDGDGVDDSIDTCPTVPNPSQAVPTWYRDADGDGYGSGSNSTQACTQPPGYVSNNTDCNDAAFAVRPGAPEMCNGIDDDCDGLIDEGVKNTYYRDADSDGYGHPSITTQACSPPSGWVSNNVDCNDSNPQIHPGATEVCNGNDDDCDGFIDEPGSIGGQTYYRDMDGDGFGTSANTVVACSPPPGYAATPGDCNDSNPQMNPAGTETCNGNDDDCDGFIDENGGTVFYLDADSDSFGSSSDTVIACTAPPGYASTGGDCDDSDPSVYPGALDVVDGKDNDCNGTVDDGIVATVPQPGVYSGLYHEPSGVTHSSGGYFTFKMAPTRKVTGSTMLAGRKHAFSGQFSSNYAASITVARTNGPNLQMNLQLVSFNNVDQVTGTVTDGSWTANLLGDRAYYSKTNITSLAGMYTFTILPNADGTFAPGYGTAGEVVVSTNGTVRVSGKLSDRVGMSQTTYLSKNGVFPLYSTLYKSTGSISGWITFTNFPASRLQGNVSWIKTNSFGKFYTNGFTNVLPAIGSVRK